jgi:hypothetical protein
MTVEHWTGHSQGGCCTATNCPTGSRFHVTISKGADDELATGSHLLPAAAEHASTGAEHGLRNNK